MADNIKQRLTDKECEIIIKDTVTLIMMNYILGDGEYLCPMSDVKAKTYAVVAKVINDIEFGISNVSQLLVESLASSMLRKEICRKEKEIIENDNKQSDK
jgi:hypothetical protein